MARLETFADSAREGKKKVRTRAKLMDAAVTVIASRGLDLASVQDIASEADVANGTFYSHFRDKEEIVAAISHGIATDLARHMDEGSVDFKDAAYRVAYATIYDRQDYAAAIPQLKALNADDRADVANLLGYSYRKLGDYKVSQAYYERALKADPGHVRTWQYYGLWQLEQGNRDQAQYHLNKIGALAGKDSPEYRSLSAALEKAPGTGLVY